MELCGQRIFIVLWLFKAFWNLIQIEEMTDFSSVKSIYEQLFATLLFVGISKGMLTVLDWLLKFLGNFQ